MRWGQGYTEHSEYQIDAFFEETICPSGDEHKVHTIFDAVKTHRTKDFKESLSKSINVLDHQKSILCISLVAIKMK